jgi:PAS domain S-box-containing protein
VADQTDAHPASPAAPIEESADELYESAPCGYLSTRPDGTILRVNQTFLTWTGHRREDLVGHKRFQELLSPGGRIFHETHYAPLLRMQGSVREIAVEVECADGRRLPALINSVMHLDEAGQPRVIRTTVFDATDRKEYERELLRARQKAERADKLKADFISMISHEIRTPLSAIIGIGHLLSSTALDPAQQKYVRILRSSSESLMGLVNDILDFSKIESGTLTLEERSFDPRELVYGIVYGLQVKAHEKGVALEVDVDPGIPPALLGDPVKIGQVLTNLIGNAVKFTQRGSVTLALQLDTLAAEGASIRFRVIDTGIGIAADRLARIFDDYTQASYDIGLKYGGTGLGLGISKKLVALHGSTIEVESEPGRGSTFSFLLRLGLPAPAEFAEASEPSPRAPLHGLRVLVADDNDVNVFVITGFLRKWGAEFDVAVSGREAVDRVKERDYDVVLMDIHMPDGDGLAATREIRSLPDARRARLPIIAVSASTRMAEPQEIDAAGFTEFVGKPVNPDVLFTKISRYVSATT